MKESEKFNPVKELHIIDAAEDIRRRADKEKQKPYNMSEYFVIVNSEPYPVKELTRTAFSYAKSKCPSFNSVEARNYIQGTLKFEIDYWPKSKKEEEKTQEEYSFFKDSGSTDPDAEIEKVIRIIKGQTIEISLLHDELQKQFQKYLQNIHGQEKVKRECRPFQSSRIDITLETDTGFILYEIKIGENLLSSIRESLGQLLEYCFYPNEKRAEKIVLVSNKKAVGEIKEYLQNIQNVLNIPFSYFCFNQKTNKIDQKI